MSKSLIDSESGIREASGIISYCYSNLFNRHSLKDLPIDAFVIS